MSVHLKWTIFLPMALRELGVEAKFKTTRSTSMTDALGTEKRQIYTTTNRGKYKILIECIRSFILIGQIIPKCQD